MFDLSDRQIPADIREAFDRAVLALLHWKRGAKEPSVTLNGGPCPVSTIFGRAGSFKEPMPANTVVFLHEYASRLLVRQEQDVELEEDRHMMQARDACCNGLKTTNRDSGSSWRGH
jgi:hypothetical protein